MDNNNKGNNEPSQGKAILAIVVAILTNPIPFALLLSALYYIITH